MMKSAGTADETKKVWAEHIQAWDARDLDGIMVHYTEESIMIVNNRVYRGTQAIRKVFQHLYNLFDNGENIITPAVIEEQVIYITWNFTPTNNSEYFGTDSFVVQKGMIKYQTIASKLYDTYPVK